MMVFHSFPWRQKSSKILWVCVGLRSGVCMLFREFLLQNDFQVPLAWGKGVDFETIGVRAWCSAISTSGLVLPGAFQFMFRVFIRSALDVLETRNLHFNNFKENKWHGNTPSVMSFVTPWEVATRIFLDKKWHQERVRKVQEIHTPKLIGGASEGGVTELSGN